MSWWYRYHQGRWSTFCPGPFSVDTAHGGFHWWPSSKAPCTERPSHPVDVEYAALVQAASRDPNRKRIHLKSASTWSDAFKAWLYRLVVVTVLIYRRSICKLEAIVCYNVTVCPHLYYFKPTEYFLSSVHFNILKKALKLHWSNFFFTKEM